MLLEACTGCLWWNPIDCHLGTDGRIASKLARAFPFPPSEVLLPSSLPREFSTAPECQSHATFPLLATWSSGGSRSGASGSGTWQDAEEGLAGALALPCRSPKHRGSLLGERSTLLLTQTPQPLSGFWLNSSYYSVSGRGWFSVAALGISVGRNVRGHSTISRLSPPRSTHPRLLCGRDLTQLLSGSKFLQHFCFQGTFTSSGREHLCVGTRQHVGDSPRSDVGTPGTDCLCLSKRCGSLRDHSGATTQQEG